MEPLVGPAGRLFNQFLVAAGTSREQASLCNTCGCVDLNREDRRPLPAEIEACRPRLLDDIERANPQVIVVMGNIANQLFFPGLSVSKSRGLFRNWNGRVAVSTFHPAYALPHRNPEVGQLIVSDIKAALALALLVLV
jgi:uracil-DNA glycosylase family 4